MDLVIRNAFLYDGSGMPGYLGEIGVCCGLVLASPAAWNVALLACFAFAQAVRMRLEERALAAEFPQYERYAACTGRLLPRLKRSFA